jgi:hypothetical protein
MKKERAPVDAYIRTGIPGKKEKPREEKETKEAKYANQTDRAAPAKLISKEEFGNILEKSKGIVKNNSKTQFIFKGAQN